MVDRDIVLNVGLNVDDVKDTAENLSDEIREIFEQSYGNDGLSSSFQGLLLKLNDLIAKSEKFQLQMSELEGQTFTTDAFNELSKQIQSVEKEYQNLKTKQQELEAQASKLTETQPTQEYVEIKQQIDSTRASLDKLIARKDKFLATGGKTSSKTFKSLQYDIDEAENSLKMLKGELTDLEQTGKATELSPQFQKVNAELENVRQKFLQVSAARDELLQKRIDLQLSGQDTVSGAETAKYKELTQDLNKVNNEMVRYLTQAEMADEITYERPTSGANALSDAFTFATKKVGDLISHLAKLAGNSIVSGIKRLASAITGVGKSASSSNLSLDKAFKTFIKYAFGVRSFFFLFRKIRSAVIAGFGDLAQVSDPFNQAVSNILTALTMLRNSLASAFSPIIEVVSPILVHFINLLSEVVTKIGMMIAALTGQKTYMRALPVQQDYAQSVAKTSKNSDKAAKSTKNLNKEAEKLKKTLAGFDDVEILKGPDDNNDSGLDGGLGNGLDDAISGTEPAFMQTALGEAFKDFADLLKRAWANADFTEVGRIVGEKLKEALEKIPWEGIKDVLRRIGKSIATFLNGFLEVPGLFDVIGKTIAEAINSAFEFVESFVSNFHWESLGNAIRDLILGVLNNIDWPLIYQTLAELGSGIGTTLNTVISDPTLWTEIFNAGFNLISAVLQGIDSFLTSVDWDLTGFAIGSGLNNGINNFSWETVSQTLIDLINGVFDLWYNFITTFDFEKFGYYIGTTLSNTINGINWQEGAASVAETMNALLEALNGFMQGTDFASIGHRVVEVIATFLDTFSWEEFGSFLSNCLQSLLNFFIGVYTSIDWDSLATSICEKIGEFLEGFDWEQTAETVMKALGVALRAMLEIQRLPYTILMNVGEKIIQAVKNGIDIDLEDIGQWMFDHVLVPLISGFLGIDEQAAAKALEMVTGFKGGVEKNWHEVPEYVEQHKDEVLESLSTESARSEQRQIGSDIDDNVKAGIEENWKAPSDYVKEHQKDLTEPLADADAVQNYKETGNTVPQSVAEGVEENWHQIQDTVDPMVQEVVDPFMSGEAQQSYNYAGEMIVAGIIDGMYSESGSLYNAAQNIAIEAYNSMVSALDIGSPSKLFRNAIGKMIPAGMALGILDNEGLVENAMDTLTGTVTNTGKKALEIPAVVKGGVIPYQATISSSTENALNDVVDMLQSNYTDNITPDDLQDILTTVISQYLNISFYLGDEQIARHANSGNLKLNRRYNKLSMGEA